MLLNRENTVMIELNLFPVKCIAVLPSILAYILISAPYIIRISAMLFVAIW